MVSYSKKRAKAVRDEAGVVLALAALLAALLALWPAGPASASVTLRFADEMTRETREQKAATAEARSFAGFRIHRTLRPARSMAEASVRPAHRNPRHARLVLTPRRLAANTVAGQPALGLSEDATVAPDLKIRTTWAAAVEPTAQDNPFTLVGNRGGLVNATQTEVRGGEVWLTSESAGAEASRTGLNTTAAP